jgi:hypothetical protein
MIRPMTTKPTTNDTTAPAAAPAQANATPPGVAVIPATSKVGLDPFAVAQIAGTKCWAHPLASDLVDEKVELQRPVLSALSTAFRAATRKQFAACRVKMALGLFGPSAATRVCSSAESEVSVNLRFDLHTKRDSIEDTRAIVTEHLVEIIRDLIKHTKGSAGAPAAGGELRFLALRAEWNNSLVRAHNRPAGLASRWTRAEIDRNQIRLSLPRQSKDGTYVAPLNVDLTLEQALFYSASPTMQFVYLEPGKAPAFMTVTLDVSYVDPLGGKGHTELGIGPASLWFQHVTSDKFDAETIASFEQDIARLFPPRYNPMIMYIAAGAQPIQAALYFGQPMIALKRMVMNMAFLDQKALLEDAKKILCSPSERLATEGARLIHTLNAIPVLHGVENAPGGLISACVTSVRDLAKQVTWAEGAMNAAERAQIKEKLLAACEQTLSNPITTDKPTNEQLMPIADLGKIAIALGQYAAHEMIVKHPEMVTHLAGLVRVENTPAAPATPAATN